MISDRWYPRIQIVLCATMVLLLPNSPCHAQMIAPGSQLKSWGYATDPASLIGYLRDGLPDNSSTLEQMPERRQNVYSGPGRLPVERWKLYEDCAHVLRERKNKDAVPVLLARLRDPLPDRLLEDLLLFVMSQWASPESWDDYEREVNRVTMSLRSTCGQALAEIDTQAAGGPIVALIEQEKEAIKQTMRGPRDAWFDVYQYAMLCGCAARTGKREGLDILFELLPETRRPNNGNIVSILKTYVEGPTPLDYEISEAEFARNVQKWQEWWAANRDSVAVAPLQKRRPSYKEITRFESVRDYVDAATQSVNGGDYIAPAYPAAIDWLKQNGSKHGRELRKLASSAQESRELRQKAFEAYIKSGGKDALRWARKTLLKSDNTLSPVERKLFFGALLNSLQGAYPNETKGLLRECVERMAPSAGVAVERIPIADDGSAEFILSHYGAIVRSFPEVRSSIVRQCKQYPHLGDISVITDCLVNGERADANIAAATVHDRNIAADLPEEARQALDRWLADPLFRLDVIRCESDKKLRVSEVVEVLRSVTGSDAHAARRYGHAFNLLTENTSGPASPEAVACLESMRRCVEAYRASRQGKPPTQ